MRRGEQSEKSKMPHDLRQDIRGDITKLSISLKRPHKEVSRDTRRCWVKTAVVLAGIDTTIFTPLYQGSSPQWAAADAEIEVPSVENTEREGSPFKAWSRSV